MAGEPKVQRCIIVGCGGEAPPAMTPIGVMQVCPRHWDAWAASAEFKRCVSVAASWCRRTEKEDERDRVVAAEKAATKARAEKTKEKP